MMKDWTDLIGEELRNLEEPLPADDWSVLQQKQTSSGKRKRAVVLAWTGSAASVAAALALFLLVNRPDASPELPESLLAEDVPVAESTVQTESIVQTESPVTESLTAPENVAVQQEPSVRKDMPEDSHMLLAEADDPDEIDVIRDTAVSPKDRLLADASDEVAAETLLFEDLYGEVPRKPERKVALAVAGSGGLFGTRYDGLRSFDSMVSPDAPPSEDGGLEPEPPLLDNPETSDSSAVTKSVPVPVMMRARGSYTDSYTHSMPVSFGISMRLQVTENMSVNTGLNYTCYSSLRDRIYHDGYRVSERQRVHYLGVPVRLDWKVLDRKDFLVYLGAGIQADRCIYASVGGERLSEKEVLWSAGGAAGIQWALTRRTGLYIEPDLTFSLNEGTLETYRTENPVMFSARAGLRFTF